MARTEVGSGRSRPIIQRTLPLPRRWPSASPTQIVGILSLVLFQISDDAPSLFPVAGQFKKAFEDARENNAKLAGAGSAASPPPATEDEPEETSEDEGEGEGEAEGNAPAPTETNVPDVKTGDSDDKGEE